MALKPYPKEAYYGFSENNFYSGSGHAFSIALSGNINTNNKAYELGVIYNPFFQTISGTVFRYKMFLNDIEYYIGKECGYNKHYRIRPYFHYNFQYFSTENTTLSSPYTSLEHYAGLGIQFLFANGLFIDSNFGLGGYMSSSKNSVAKKTIGIHNSKHGFTANFDVGVGFYIF